MGYEVTTFKVTWGLSPKARLRLKSSGNSDIQKVNAIATKAHDVGILVSTLITNAATAKRIQSTMELGTAYLAAEKPTKQSNLLFDCRIPVDGIAGFCRDQDRSDARGLLTPCRSQGVDLGKISARSRSSAITN